MNLTQVLSLRILDWENDRLSYEQAVRTDLEGGAIRGASKPTGDRLTLTAEAGDRSAQEPWVSRGSWSGLGKHCRKSLGINKKQCHVISVSLTVTEPLLVPDASSGSSSPGTVRTVCQGATIRTYLPLTKLHFLQVWLPFSSEWESRWVSGGSRWLLFLSKKGHAWGFSCCAPGLLCLLFYTQMVLSEGHIWLKYTSVFGLLSTNLAWAVFFKTELRHKNETPGFSWKIRILSTLSPCSC